MAQTNGTDSQDTEEVRFADPPLLEVVCEFRFEADEAWNPLLVARIGELLRDTFPTSRLDEDDEDQIQFLAANDEALVQIGEHYLSVNYRFHYPSWEDYVPLVFQGLEAYVEAVRPTKISGAGLRYINLIDVENVGFSLSEYFNIYPFVHRDVAPNMVSDFSMGITTPYEDGHDEMRIQMYNTEGKSSSTSALLLDVQYYIRPSKTLDLNFNVVGEWLHTAHGHIKQAFLACITDKLREQFQEIR